MANYPSDITLSNWKADTVGGAYGEPLLFKLYQTELVSNGSFEDTLVGWDGGGECKDLGNSAMVGNYALAMENIAYMHTYFDRTSPDNSLEMDNILFTGFIKSQQDDDVEIKVRVYASNDTARNAAPAKYVDLKIKVDDDCIVTDVDGLTQWIQFYLMADITAHAGTYVHLEISCTDFASIDYYLDDLRVHEVMETLELDDPQSLKLKWQRKTDANYEMADGSNKDYVRGWRPVYSISYEYCSRAELIKHIGISENSYNFFAPHKDSINGDYVRHIQDFDSSYFRDRFLGHENAMELMGIYLRKFKNIEFGGAYFELVLPPV